MDYWGGAEDGNQCACSKTKTCAGNKNCNCAVMDGRTRWDGGYIFDRYSLPIKQLRFGGLRQQSRAIFSVGAIKCSARAFGNIEKYLSYAYFNF